MSEVLLSWRWALWEREKYFPTVGWILDNTMYELTFRSTIKKINVRRLLVGSFGLPGFCKAVSNPWLTLIYSCFAKMLLTDPVMRSCSSSWACFRSSGCIWSYAVLCCFEVCECFWLLLWLFDYQEVLDC